jgi:hypothetical protein
MEDAAAPQVLRHAVAVPARQRTLRDHVVVIGGALTQGGPVRALGPCVDAVTLGELPRVRVHGSDDLLRPTHFRARIGVGGKARERPEIDPRVHSSPAAVRGETNEEEYEVGDETSDDIMKDRTGGKVVNASRIIAGIAVSYVRTFRLP